MSHVGSSTESLFAAGASTSESPNTSIARFVTSVVDTVVALRSTAVCVLAVALGEAAGAVGGAAARLVESPGMRFGAPATITVCGWGAGAGCE
jgi:hypothetical protein